MSFCFWLGRTHFELIARGEKARGEVIAVEEEVIKKKGVVYMPIVKFQVNQKSYQFRNHKGSSNSSTGYVVDVLYDPEEPEKAMIDEGSGNLLPWGPIFIMGILGLVIAVDRRKKGTVIRRPATIEEGHRLALEGHKVEAIKVYRKATGVGLKEAKEYVDSFLKNNRIP